MNIIERNVPNSVIGIINLLIMTIFIPILLYAVYQTVIIVNHANETEANITVNTINYDKSFDKTSLPEINHVSKSKNRIISMLNELTGIHLTVKGETDSIFAHAVLNKNTILVFVMNSALPEKRVKIVPLTIENLTPGKYNMQVNYALETGCAINDPPINNPPRILNITDNKISINTCLSSGNAVLWKITKL
jgi:hypothetical protein